jgi:hypothetical protein
MGVGWCRNPGCRERAGPVIHRTQDKKQRDPRCSRGESPALSDIDQAAVLRAIEEFDRLGRDAVLRKHSVVG